MLLIVQPDTLLRWHRQGFRLVWRARSATASKRPQVAAATVAMALRGGDEGGRDLAEFQDALLQSWLTRELKRARNVGAALHRFGPWLGGAYAMAGQMVTAWLHFYMGR